MYFWRIEELKSKLAVAPLTEKEVLPYFMVFVVLTTTMTLFPFERANHWDDFYAAYAVLVSILGTLYLYRKNGGHAGSLFIQRYLAIGLVVAVRWLALFFPLLIVLLIAIGLPEETTASMFAYYVIMVLVFYQRLGHHMSDVAARTRESSNFPPQQSGSGVN